MTKTVSSRRRLSIAVSAFAACMLYMLVTTPGKVSLPLLLVPFGLVAIAVFELSSMMLAVAVKSKSPVLQRVIPAGISAMLVTILLLQSLNQLTWKDGLILLALVAFVGVYLWRADFLNK